MLIMVKNKDENVGTMSTAPVGTTLCEDDKCILQSCFDVVEVCGTVKESPTIVLSMIVEEEVVLVWFKVEK